MFDQIFADRQQRLHDVYDRLGVVRWILAILAFTSSGYFSAQFDQTRDPSTDALGATSLWVGIGILVVISLVRYFIREKLKADLWAEYERVSGDKNEAITRPEAQTMVGPVVSRKSSSMSVKRILSGHHMNRTTHLQEVQVTYEQRSHSHNKPTYSFNYLVLAVELDEFVPHIFIDGKSQNKKSLKNRNLWSLTKKLDKDQKMQELEGDFSNYFDVYTPHRSAGGTVYKKEIDALRVLTPDTMLALRDDGHEFDYELHNQTLYVIHESTLLTTYSFDGFIKALEVALTELLPQLTNHKFEIDGSELTIIESPFDLDIVVKTLFQACSYILLGLAFGALGVFVGGL